jgi:hypothetical protein
MIGKLRPLRNVASRNWIQNNIRRNLEESCSVIFASHGATIFFQGDFTGIRRSYCFECVPVTSFARSKRQNRLDFGLAFVFESKRNDFSCAFPRSDSKMLPVIFLVPNPKKALELRVSSSGGRR